MSFPVNPKNGLVHKHRNGLTYVYNKEACTWDIVHDDMTPVAGFTPRKTRKESKALNPAKPTIDTNAINMGVSNELS